MKVEETEAGIRLIAESDFERDKLKKLRQRGVEKIAFEDDWDFKGPLTLSFPVHPWDKDKR